MPALAKVPDPLGLGVPLKLKKYEKLPLGRRKLDGKGYVLVKTEQGLVHEHRLVAEQKILKRPLRRDEAVVRKPGVKRWDNRPAGLEVFTGVTISNGRPAERLHPGARPQTRYEIVRVQGRTWTWLRRYEDANKEEQALGQAGFSKPGYRAIPVSVRE